LSYRRLAPIGAVLLSFDLVKRMLSQARAIFFITLFDFFVNATFYTDTCAIVKVATFRALKPHVFSICCLLGHYSPQSWKGEGGANAPPIPIHIKTLLNDLSNNTGTNRAATFANRETKTQFHCDWFVFKID